MAADDRAEGQRGEVPAAAQQQRQAQGPPPGAGPSAAATAHQPTSIHQRPILDRVVIILYACATTTFLVAASMRIANAGTRVHWMGSLLRVPAAALLVMAATTNALADRLAMRRPARVPQPQRPRHPFDYPAAYLQLAATVCYAVAASLVIGGARTAPAGGLMWLVGSALALASTALLLAAEMTRTRKLAAMMTREADGRGDVETAAARPQPPPATVAAAARNEPAVPFAASVHRLTRSVSMATSGLASTLDLPLYMRLGLQPTPQLIIALLFFAASLVFTVGSAIYIGKGPVDRRSEVLLCTGSALFLVGIVTDVVSGYAELVVHRRNEPTMEDVPQQTQAGTVVANTQMGNSRGGWGDGREHRIAVPASPPASASRAAHAPDPPRQPQSFAEPRPG